MAPHSSTLAWKIPWTEEPGRLHGVARSRTRLSNFTFTFHFHALEKEMATHSSVLAWRIPETEEPGGLPSLGSHRVGHDWSDLAVAVAAVNFCCTAKWFSFVYESSSHSVVLDSATPWTVAHQAPLSLEFSRQKWWSVAIPFSRGYSQPRDQTQVSCIAGRLPLGHQGSPYTVLCDA